MIYDVPYGTTLHSEAFDASIYRAGLAGAEADLSELGSMSVDITAARTRFNDGRGNANGSS